MGREPEPKNHPKKSVKFSKSRTDRTKLETFGAKGPWVIPVDAPDCRIMKHHL